METTSPGGINKVVAEIGNNLSNQGHEVIVLQPNPLNLNDEEIYKKFKIIRIKSKIDKILYGFNPEFNIYLKKKLKKINPDIIHVHGYHSAFIPGVFNNIKKNNSKKHIIFSPHFDISSHDTFAGKYLWYVYNKLIGKKIMNFSNPIVAASEFEANNIKNILHVSKEKIKIIPHGVNYNDFQQKKRKIDTIYLFSAGYLLKLKGVQYGILTLYELIYKMNKNARLTIIGDGPYQKKLKKLAIKLKVDKFINWRGFVSREDLLKEFKKNDIFFLLSESENYGIVVAEALAYGIPVIVTKKTALKEFIKEPGCFGVDYPPDPKEVAELVVSVLKSNIRVGPFSKKIRTWDNVAKDYENLYNRYIEKN
jgi:glycosyltransferase involved in cell wall biosynthesis